jgi:hypothetical protein
MFKDFYTYGFHRGFGFKNPKGKHKDGRKNN